MNIDEFIPRILAVDDVPKNLQIINIILKEGGYAMDRAENGQVALDMAFQNKYDLILLDVMMPGMSGFEVCEILKSDPRTKEIPIIFLSARGDADSTVKGFDLGAVDYVSKPFNSTELLARLRTHIQLRQARLELQRANAAKDKFFSIIAHDLKNPLGSFLNVADYMFRNLSTISEEDMQDFVEDLHTASKNLYNLLINLLEWSRAQLGTIQYCPDIITLDALAENTVSLVKMAAESKNITLKNEIAKVPQLYADVNMVITVIRNLLTNAVKFTPRGGEISIFTSEEDEYVRIHIKDNGVGIPPENIEKLFKIDEFTSTAGTDNEKGTGLGVILCKEFVEKNHGEIRVISQPGEGSEFSFTLPKYTGTEE